MKGSDAVFETNLDGAHLLLRGKVRDVYDLGERLLFVATDRLSAFDYVLPDPIPDKGRVLNQLSLFWFERLRGHVPNHVISASVDEVPDSLGGQLTDLRGRAMIVRKLRMLPIECVARGYLAGSGWNEYRQSGTVCGIRLPEGLDNGSKLPTPIFTPATKAHDGHDENISFDEAVRIVGGDVAERARELTLTLYSAGAEHALDRGVLIADTKFEFGVDDDGGLVLADEVLTPDSSRFWPVEDYRPGQSQPSFDKQFVRDHLESIGWDKNPPVPNLPEAIIEGTRARYLEIYRILTGHELD